MTAGSVKTIESLARGISVLLCLQKNGPMPLAQIHKATGLPKPSLLRILKTLMEQGVIWQRMADNAYVASVKLIEHDATRPPEMKLVEIAAPIMRQLSLDVKWPSVLAVPRSTHMEVIDTNAPHAEIEDVPLGPIGFEINMLRSASGRAFLSYCDRATLDTTLDTLRRSKRQGDRLAHNSSYIEKMITDTRAKGYALRDPDFGGDYDALRHAIDDKRNSIAAPLFDGPTAIGAINITWTLRAMKTEDAVERFLAPLLDAADKITRAYSKAP